MKDFAEAERRGIGVCLFGAEVGGWIFIISVATLSLSGEPGWRLKVASQLSGFPSYLTLNIGPVNCPSIPFSSRLTYDALPTMHLSLS